LTKLLAALFCVLSLVSCLSLRYAERHGKDDYRAAAAFAKAALRNDRQVWWSAAEQGAGYYGVPVAHDARSGVFVVVNPTRESLDSLPSPQVIIASKPDIYDRQRALAGYVRTRGFRRVGELPAFTLWEKD
jgi:hypothetical protein